MPPASSQTAAWYAASSRRCSPRASTMSPTPATLEKYAENSMIGSGSTSFSQPESPGARGHGPRPQQNHAGKERDDGEQPRRDRADAVAAPIRSACELPAVVAAVRATTASSTIAATAMANRMFTRRAVADARTAVGSSDTAINTAPLIDAIIERASPAALRALDELGGQDRVDDGDRQNAKRRRRSEVAPRMPLTAAPTLRSANGATGMRRRRKSVSRPAPRERPGGFVRGAAVTTLRRPVARAAPNARSAAQLSGPIERDAPRHAEKRAPGDREWRCRNARGRADRIHRDERGREVRDVAHAIDRGRESHDPRARKTRRARRRAVRHRRLCRPPKRARSLHGGGRVAMAFGPWETWALESWSWTRPRQGPSAKLERIFSLIPSSRARPRHPERSPVIPS